MQEEHQQEPYFLRAKLLEAVDGDYNVKDMPLILEVLGKLEVLQVSKEILEATRLGKTVNEFRRKVNDAILARRLKDLVKKWRDAVLVNEPPQPRVNGTSSSGEGAHAGHGGNRMVLPLFSSGYTSVSSSPTLVTFSSRVSPAGSFNSNSLSPRIGTLTNYANNNNNNTSVHNIPVNRNGSSSIPNNRSPNHRNPHHLSSSSYATLVSPSASSASPLLSSRSLVSPYKSKSPGGPTLAAISSKISPMPSSQIQSTSSSYAPNADTVSRTNAANKRYRELDDSPNNASVEPPLKKSRSAPNGTLDDPMLALDDISRDSYASRGSDHSDGLTSKDHRFSLSAPTPATPAQVSNILSPQMPVPGNDSNVPSPATPFDEETVTISQVETQPKKKRRKKQNEFYQDSEAILREKIAQAQAEKAAKAAREREMQNREREAQLALAQSQEVRRRVMEEAIPEDKVTSNVFVDKYLKSQNELRAKMERDAVDALSTSDFQGAQEDSNEHGVSPGKVSKKDKKKHKKKQALTDGPTDDSVNTHQFPSETEILSKLPPIDPEILKEFENFKYDVNPSPVQPVESGGGDIPNSYNKETDSTNNLKSLSTTIEEKPRKLIDWGDSDDDDMDDQSKAAAQAADIISQQIQVISSESVVEVMESEPITTVIISSSEDVTDNFVDDNENIATTAPHRDVDESEVEQYIKEDVPNLNGNYDKEGLFREWHETLTVDSYKGEPLHILPYTIIDF